MSNHHPYAPLGIIAMESMAEFGRRCNDLLMAHRARNEGFDHGGEAGGEAADGSFLVPLEEVWFSTGEGKVVLRETVRGKDIVILCDVLNYAITHPLHGFVQHAGPDQHFQNLKRVLSAIGGKARRVTVIMPFLYESRQDKRKSRESLDAAMALQELSAMGVNCILTFDAHNPGIQNAIPLVSFENLLPTKQMIEAILQYNKNIQFDRQNCMVVSPDFGASDKAAVVARILGLDMGMFYKKRDVTRVVNGKNPIVEHKFIGGDTVGKDVLVVEDMIASGESILDVAEELKAQGARRILIAATFGLFTEGPAALEKAHRQGKFDQIFVTNLNYLPPEIRRSDWLTEVDMTDYLANLIDMVNYDMSLAPLLEENER